MEETKELKHVCKFCSKRFGCGRSLGGHMRSHMINDISAQSDGTKLTRKKLPSLDTFINNNNNNGNNNNNNNNKTTSTDTTTTPTVYGLRENPKKTWRLKDHSSTEDTSSLPSDKSCKECGKSFPSWKALFGHMKCHSVEKERLFNANNSLEEHQDSWTSGNNDQKLVMDSQSDNETATPNRRKRSKRRTRYMVATNSSSLSFADNKNNNNNNNNPSSSMSEIEQEQEEVAMCLILLSRDVGQWGGFNSVAESSDNNSVFLETNQVNPKVETKNSPCDGSETQKLKEHTNSKSEIGKLESGSCEFTKNLATLVEAEMGSSKYNLSKRKLQQPAENSESMSDSLKKLTTDLVDNKSSKFECATCNKVFYSYQALGGHRASHKKIKGCFASKIDSSENSIDTEVTPDQVAATDSNLHKIISDAVKIDQLMTESDKKGETRKSRGHECPICLRVFPSGQALGGHKRSHLVVGAIEAKNNSNQTIKIEEPMPGIRDFLDLNLPAPVEEESNGIAGFNPWWIPSTHKHEPLVGLISNQVL